MSVLTMDEAERLARIAEFVALTAGDPPPLASDLSYAGDVAPRRTALGEERACWPLLSDEPTSRIRLVHSDRSG